MKLPELEVKYAATCTAQYLITDFRKKNKLDGKLSKPLVKNFEIWLSSLKETFLDAENTNNMHSDNLIFLPSERGWFFRNGKTDSFPKWKIFLFWKQLRKRVCGTDFCEKGAILIKISLTNKFIYIQYRHIFACNGCFSFWT